MKRCKICNKEYPYTNFWKYRASKDGYDSKCKKCGVIYNRPFHREGMRRYRRTLNGFLDQKYTAMSKRVRGKDKNCINTVKGLPIVAREVFYEWAKQQKCLFEMFDKYKDSDFDIRFCPTIDRIDSSKGYTLDNMQFLYFTDNCKKH